MSKFLFDQTKIINIHKWFCIITRTELPIKNNNIKSIYKYESIQNNTKRILQPISKQYKENNVYSKIDMSTKNEDTVQQKLVETINNVKDEEEKINHRDTTIPMVINIISQQKEKEIRHNIWKESLFKDLIKLQSNNVGIVGEKLIDKICEVSGIDADCNGSKTKKIGGGEGDGKIMDIPVEIKTAHQGSSSPSFQHELGEVPWKGGKYMIFVDFTPECIYITIFKNFVEETYKSKEKLLPYFPTKSITWRKGKGAFKLDTSVQINERNVENKYAIKITSTTTIDSVASFIKSVIV